MSNVIRPTNEESACADLWHLQESIVGEKSVCPSCGLHEDCHEKYTSYHYKKPFWKGERRDG